MDGRKVYLYIIFVCIFVFTLASCGGGCDKYGPGVSVPVTVEPVKTQQSSPTVTVPGVLIPRDRVEVKLSYPAKIAEVYANNGDRVVQGTPLAKLSDDEINLKLNQLRAARKDAETLSEKNTYLLKNRDRLIEEGKIDRTQYEALEIETANSEAALNKVKADLAVVEYNAAHLTITAPISGIITEKYVSPMQNAAENQTLFVLVNTDPILVSFQLTADESSGVETGMAVQVFIDALDGAEYKAAITYIGPEIHQPGKTFDVWAAIPNQDYVLKAGMQATAQFTSTLQHKVFVVPESALITINRDKNVFTVSGGVAHQTKVHIRNIHDGIAEISDGLAENDLVVVKGGQSLQEGSTVDMWRR